MTTKAPTTIADLLAVMAALRTPGSGCPWDLAQDFKSIAPYTIEEAYEVADAIERDDMAALKEELGDLLLQVVYHARMAEEGGAFVFADVVDAITAKMRRRHPHVFGTAAERAAGAAPGFWERIKAEERAEKSQPRPNVPPSAVGGPPIPNPSPRRVADAPSARGGGGQVSQGGREFASGESGSAASILADVPLALPALARAIKLQNKAARVGFDWPSLAPVFAKLKEEFAELEAAVAAGPRASDDKGADEKVAEEFGDILFVAANVARHLGIDAEGALRGANAKFVRRFRRIEALLAVEGRTPAQSTLAEMDRLWDQAKAEERE